MKKVSRAIPEMQVGGSCSLTLGVQGVLYLMIVNMPTTEELSNVRATMEREHDEA